LFAFERITITPNDQSTYQSITILDSVKLSFDDLNDIPFTEVSDIAYDPTNQKLYAISDHGYLYHLDVILKDNQFKTITLNSAIKFPHLKKIKRDSEGLDLVNGKLLISFEHAPRLSCYDTEGMFQKGVKTQKILTNIKYYRDKNKGLEGVVYHPKYGAITAAELPLQHHKKKFQTLYSQTQQWHFYANETKKSAITALEVLPNDNILVLERAYTLFSHVITLSEVDIHNCNEKRICQQKTLAHLRSKDGWHLDNFEGLTHVKDNIYMMISDDNENPLQETLLVLFKICSNC
jgi:hypothetical protein